MGTCIAVRTEKLVQAVILLCSYAIYLGRHFIFTHTVAVGGRYDIMNLFVAEVIHVDLYLLIFSTL